jgi:hypothetical protein
MSSLVASWSIESTLLEWQWYAPVIVVVNIAAVITAMTITIVVRRTTPAALPKAKAKPPGDKAYTVYIKGEKKIENLTMIILLIINETSQN